VDRSSIHPLSGFEEGKTTMIDQTAEALIYLGNRAVEQGNDALARSLYEEGMAIWQALDDAPCMADALKRLRTLEGNLTATSEPQQSFGS
jgi:hypothetical protein